MKRIFIYLSTVAFATSSMALSCLQPIETLKGDLERDTNTVVMAGYFSPVTIGRFGPSHENFVMWDPADPSTSQREEFDKSTFVFSGEVIVGKQAQVLKNEKITINRMCHSTWGCGSLPSDENRFITRATKTNFGYEVSVYMCPSLISDTPDARAYLGLPEAQVIVPPSLETQGGSLGQLKELFSRN